MPDTRQDILNILRENGQADVNALAERLHLSSVTVHYHINILQRDGLLEITPTRQGVGRPRNVISLRESAREKFPQGYHRLSDRLLESLKDRLTGSDLQNLFERIGDEIAAEHAAALAGKTLEQKIAVLIELLGEEGFLSRLEKIDANDFVLTQYNCPYQYVVNRHPEVCELDLRLINAALGTPVERQSCIVHGDSACKFHITLNP